MQSVRPHMEHSGQWKRGFAQAMAGVLWDENEHPDWKEGHSAAQGGMLMGRLPDRHGLLIRQEREAKAQWEAWKNNEGAG